ncbi:response regulator transcription factor [Superficieibacter sp. 1612_C1]|uniref:helix-turn-helix transcriptional regulator n=1 Tax=Superficieibacter sp. 1612_C1 TaxID=2780382 RepID=UPI0015A06505|nr:response regulator transcription factor [Superficieibacter sp. 1612_C1]MDU2937696.1 response regulator transcription factor [Enterobacteriaceae bacterium]
MVSGHCKHGVIISKIPVMQTGLSGIMELHFPDYELTSCQSPEELTLFQLRRAALVLVDLSGEFRHARTICEQYYALISQYRDIHWIFLVSRSIYPLAVEFLMRPESTLLSDAEPVDHVVKAIHAGGLSAERISQTLLAAETQETVGEEDSLAVLTLSERKVLRLLGKGWGINQIAALLKKSNKTISAQKNSAMRRLALRSNAEMYAWINSAQGMKELNLFSAYGDSIEWKRAPQSDMSLS